MMKNTCRLPRSSEEITWRFAISFLSRHLTLTFFVFCYSMSDWTQSMSVTFCIIKNSGASRIGCPLAALSPLFGPLDLLLVVLGHPPWPPPFTNPLEVTLITWILTNWQAWRIWRYNPYFMHFAWGDNKGFFFFGGVLNVSAKASTVPALVRAVCYITIYPY